MMGSCASSKWSASIKGATDAREELRKGSMALEVYGEFAGTKTLSEKYLAERGVEIRAVAGCMVNNQIIGHAQGFNRVMKQGIKDELGNDVFDKAEQAAPVKHDQTLRH